MQQGGSHRGSSKGEVTAAATNSCNTNSQPTEEIPDLLSWVSCFGVYVAVLTSKHPNMTKQLLDYQTMIIREAWWCRGNGWLQYDSFFQQKVAGTVDADWTELNTSLYAVTFLAKSSKGGQHYTSFMEFDHMQQECVM